MKGKLSKLICVVLLSVLFASGCASQRVWTYKAESYVKTEPLVNKTVAVIPLTDRRENINKNMLGIGMIPLVPYGWQDMYTPEGGQRHVTSGIWLFKPSEDLAKAIAEELHNSSIFKEVFFTNRATEGELVLRGEIKSTFFKGKQYTYCLSAMGVYLWFIGLPAASAQNDLEISLQLEDSATGKILWAESYKKSKSATSWIYVMKPDFFYDSLLKEIMKEVIPSLKAKFASQRS